MDPTTVESKDVAHRRWFLLGLLGLLLLLNVKVLFKVQNDSGETRSAIVRWLPQLADLADGKDIWRRHNYPNPPIMALILSPLNLFPAGAAALIWFYLKVVMTALAVYWLYSLLDRPERPFPFWGKALAILLSFRPIQGDLTHGNVNLFILFLVVGCLAAFTQRRDWLAGLSLALAIACKVTPALFVPYFLWKRAWKTMTATAVGLGLFLLIIPSARFGWDRNWTYLKSWHQVMVQPFVVEGSITSEHQNQSLPGLAARLLTKAPSFATYIDDRYVPVAYHNVAELDRETVQWILKGCMGLFALLVLWRCRTPLGDRTDWRLFAEYGVVFLGMLLFSERTWKHHAVTLVVPFAVLCYALSAQALSKARRALIVGALALASLAMLSTSTGLWDGHDQIGKAAQVYGAYIWAYLILTAALFIATGWNVSRPGSRECGAHSDRSTSEDGFDSFHAAA